MFLFYVFILICYFLSIVVCGTGEFSVFVNSVDNFYLLYHSFFYFLRLVAVVTVFSVEGLSDFISSAWPLSIVIPIN